MIQSMKLCLKHFKGPEKCWLVAILRYKIAKINNGQHWQSAPRQKIHEARLRLYSSGPGVYHTLIAPSSIWSIYYYRPYLIHQPTLLPTLFTLNSSSNHLSTNSLLHSRMGRTPDTQQKTPLYPVQAIVDKKIIDGELNYLIKWKGYSEQDNTWEPAWNLQNIKRQIEEFDREVNRLRGKKIRKEARKKIPKDRMMRGRLQKSSIQKQKIQIPKKLKIPLKRKPNTTRGTRDRKKPTSHLQHSKDDAVEVIKLNQEENPQTEVEYTIEPQNLESFLISRKLRSSRKNKSKDLNPTPHKNSDFSTQQKPHPSRTTAAIDIIQFPPLVSFNLQEYLQRSEQKLAKGKILSINQPFLCVDIQDSTGQLHKKELVSLKLIKDPNDAITFVDFLQRSLCPTQP